MPFIERSGAGCPAPERTNRHYRRMWGTLWLGLAMLVAAGTGAAQADRIDAGSFSVSEKGVRLGREQFSVRRTPSPDGSAFEMRAESVFGERRLAVQQTVDSMGSPVRYSLEIREGTTVTLRAGGQRVRGRFVTQARRPTGESAREYLLAPDVIILEPGLYHQYAVILRGRRPEVGRPVEMTVLSLLEFSQQRLNLTLEARDDSVVIAGAPRPAHRWRLGSGSALERTIWTDALGRLLKVRVAALFLEAIRDDLPR